MRNKSTNIIEINGKRYDAVNGSFLGHNAAAKTKAAAKNNGFSIDGVMRPGSSVAARVNAAATLAPTIKKAKRAAAAHVAPHKPEHAKTLMRSAVKKPDLKPTRKISVSSRAEVAAKSPQHVITPKLSHFSIDPSRQKRASQVIQSSSVSRFGSSGPLEAIAPYSPTLHLTPAPAKPTPVAHIAVTPVHHPAKQPDIFASALAKATSHEQTYSSKKHKSAKRGRLALATSVSLVFLLVLGVFAYVNVPAISVHLASAKAGFQAKLPAYSPAGYSFGNLSYGPGNVTVSYKDGSSANQQFDIQQRASGWDNEALLNNFVASANKAYQTYQRAGHTIYMYGNNTATWVDSGVWYTVDGNGSLSRGQILDLASSL